MLFKKSYLKSYWFIGLVITILFLVFAELKWFAAFDRKAYNLGAEISSAKEPRDDIVIVAIDDKSLQKLGAWPWLRDVLAETTQLISKAKPKVIGFNLPFDSRQHGASLKQLGDLRQLLKQENKLNNRVIRALARTESSLLSDEKLAKAFKQGGRIVLSMSYRPAGQPASGLSASMPKYMQRFSLPNVHVSRRHPGGFGWPTPMVTRAESILPPIEILSRQVGAVGVISAFEDFNHEPLVVQYGEEYLPSFALMVATRSKNLSMQHIDSRVSVTPTLDGKRIGTDVNLKVLPRYYASQGNAPAFRVYSLIDVLSKAVSLDVFREKVVLIGMTSPRLAQTRVTPDGQVISTTMATAHIVSSILNRELFQLPDWAGWVQRGLIILLGLYLMFAIRHFRPNTAIFLSLFLLLMIFNVHFVLLGTQSVWVPMMTAVVMLIVGHLVLGIRQIFTLRVAKIEEALSLANKQLGQALQSQGQLDQAFEKFCASNVDDTLLLQVYNLGLDYERKRMFNKAASVFKYIQRHDPKFNDVAERISKNEQASNTVTLHGTSNTGPSDILLQSGQDVQKPKLGRYEIDSEIGKGAMGMVYLGHDDKIGRTVAIKTMMFADDLDAAERDDVRNRFFREAEAAGRLDHPNIVTVYDVGDEQDLAYIAMDYLPGKDLTAFVNNTKSLLPVSQTFQIVTSVALALDYAHKQHVVHRDIKPANIIYNPEKRTAKITDFSVACLTDASKTKTGTVLGSPYYMAPEQLAGKKVDGRADLFALGVTLYQMLTAELPFTGESMANLMYNIANEPHPDIRRYRSGLPNCIGTVINKALEKDAANRFQSGEEMATAMSMCRAHIKEMEAA